MSEDELMTGTDDMEGHDDDDLEDETRILVTKDYSSGILVYNELFD